MKVNLKRIRYRMEKINQIGKTEDGGITRLAFSAEDIQARNLITNMMEEAGLEVRVDGAGNIVGRLIGSDVNSKVVAMGSHIDTVINGGKFDGLTGVICALEVLDVINSEKADIKNSIEMIVFADEEGVRFSNGMFGSRAFIGKFDEKELLLKDNAGITLEAVLKNMGLYPNIIINSETEKNKYKAFLELHVEQGGILYEKKKRIGIVSAIKGPHWLRGTIIGNANHAGSTPMKLRKDALAALGEFMYNTEKIAKNENEFFVSTIGCVNVKPGATNVIPGMVEFTMDIRDISKDRREKNIKKFKNLLANIAKTRGLDAKLETLKAEDPINLKSYMIELIDEICKDLNINAEVLPSGAFHDALIMSEITDIGMIFVPSKDGISHSPKEFTRWDDIELGANVLLNTVIKLTG